MWTCRFLCPEGAADPWSTSWGHTKQLFLFICSPSGRRDSLFPVLPFPSKFCLDQRALLSFLCLRREITKSTPVLSESERHTPTFSWLSLTSVSVCGHFHNYKLTKWYDSYPRRKSSLVRIFNSPQNEFEDVPHTDGLRGMLSVSGGGKGFYKLPKKIHSSVKCGLLICRSSNILLAQKVQCSIMQQNAGNTAHL